MSDELEIDIVAASGAPGVEGAAVVIDVLRAFTTAAFAFAAGAREILLTAAVEEAFALRERYPRARLMGEVGGDPIEGFDFGNSPSQLEGRSLAGEQLIQRTTAGTRAAIAARDAELLLVSSFVCAGATVEHLLARGRHRVGLVLSGRRDRWDGNDDAACADLLAARLRAAGTAIDPGPYVERCRRTRGAAKFLDPKKPDFPARDLELALDVDRFDFAMVVSRRGDELVVSPTG